MRRALLLLFFVVTPLFGADDPTANLLTAVPVQDVIQFKADKNGVTYRVDDAFNGTLAESVAETFAAPRSVDLTYHDFNPFKVIVTSTETASADPNQKAVSDFLDALLAFGKGLAPGKLAAASLLPTGKETLEKTVSRWVNEAHGRTGIEKVRGEVLDKIAEYETAAHTLAAYPSIEAFSDTKDLLKALNALLKVLDDYLAKTWRNDDDLLIRAVASDPANQKTIALSFALRSYAFNAATNTITATTDSELTRSLIIRRYRRFVPEVGVAAVYNELKYPKYTAEKQADNTFLVRTKKNDANVDAALTLNMLCNCFKSDFLFPGFQLGISKAEDYPGIMAGGVLRFAQPKKLSVAFGRMVTWYKDLDKLEVDKPVTSEDALTKDLKRKRSPAAWYFAVQYTF